MARAEFNELLEAGVHFGHLKRKWHPGMAPYIFMEKNGIHIIDLHKTVAKIDESADALKKLLVQVEKSFLLQQKNKQKKLLLKKFRKLICLTLPSVGVVVC